MAGVRANWFMDIAEVDRSDPFAPVAPAIPVEPDTEPFEKLIELARKEMELAMQGVECDLKSRDWAHPTCSDCPLRGEVAVAALCRVGLAQEDALKTLKG